MAVEKIKVERAWVEGGNLMVELSSADRETLTENGRQAVVDHVSTHPEWSAWALAGVDKAGGPQAFDPTDPGKDPYDPKNGKTKWHWKQLLRMTRMI
jgi:hypothetical protein